MFPISTNIYSADFTYAYGLYYSSHAWRYNFATTPILLHGSVTFTHVADTSALSYTSVGTTHALQLCQSIYLVAWLILSHAAACFSADLVP